MGRAAFASSATVLAVLVAALGFGARAGGMPAQDAVVHAPVAVGGPPAGRARPAVDGAVRGARPPRQVPYRRTPASVSGPAGEGSYQGASPGTGRVRVPFDGDYAIRFESVNHEATVFVDGRLAAHHTGAYLPFEARPHAHRRPPHAARAGRLALARRR